LLRAATNFDYELQMAQMNKQLKPGIETIFMFSNPKLFFTASRLIREVAGCGLSSTKTPANGGV